MDFGLTLFGSPPPPSQPSIAALPEPTEPPSLMSFLSATYQPFSLPGDETDALIVATNNLIAAMNNLTDDYNSGITEEVYRDHAIAIGEAIDDITDEIDALGFSVTLSQADYDAILSEIASSGLPDFEVAFLQDAGWSAADIQELGEFVGGVEFNLAVPTVSSSTMLRAAADAKIPEPATLALLSVGLAALCMIRKRRQV